MTENPYCQRIPSITTSTSKWLGRLALAASSRNGRSVDSSLGCSAAEGREHETAHVRHGAQDVGLARRVRTEDARPRGADRPIRHRLARSRCALSGDRTAGSPQASARPRRETSGRSRSRSERARSGPFAASSRRLYGKSGDSVIRCHSLCDRDGDRPRRRWPVGAWMAGIALRLGPALSVGGRRARIQEPPRGRTIVPRLQTPPRHRPRPRTASPILVCARLGSV